jgi:hypothetical protein
VLMQQLLHDDGLRPHRAIVVEFRLSGFRKSELYPFSVSRRTPEDVLERGHLHMVAAQNSDRHVFNIHLVNCGWYLDCQTPSVLSEFQSAQPPARRCADGRSAHRCRRYDS